jgi:hypothetical protein
VDVVALVLAVVALIVAVIALRRVDVVEGRVKRWVGEPGGPVTIGATGSGDGTAGAPAPSAAPAPVTLDRGLSRVAVVHYDAFEDLGGRLSFSAAVLDDDGRGLVLTTIHGRSETRSYVKQVPPPADGSQRELSPEEENAVGNAMRGGDR